MFCTPVTYDQMKEESRVATEAGMRELANALKDSPLGEMYVIDEACTDSDEGPPSKRRRPKNNRANEKWDSSDVLEGRIHILTLEAANAQIAIQDAVKEAGEIRERLNPYIRVNTEFALIHSVRERGFNGVEELTTEQFKEKIALFDEESREHLALCSAAIEKIDLHQVQHALQRVLASERRHVASQKEKLKMMLVRKHAWKIGVVFCTAYGVICVLLTMYRFIRWLK